MTKKLPGGKFDTTVSEQRVAITAPGGVVIEQRHDGYMVQVPPGWAHAVLNRAPSFRIAWETTDLQRAAASPRVPALKSKFMGTRAAEEYKPFQAVAFDIMR